MSVTPPQLAMLMHGDLIGGARGGRDMGGDAESVYGVANLLRVDEAVDMDAIVLAWRAVFAEFSALRSRFSVDPDGRWAMLTDDAVTDAQIRICDGPAEADEAYLRGRMRVAAQSAADHRRPAFAEVYATGRPHVILAYHHALLDGWSSAAVIHRALAYMRHFGGLGDPPAPVEDVLRNAQESLVAASNALDVGTFWRDSVAVMPPSLVGQRTDGPAVPDELTEELDARLWSDLVPAARRLGVTLPALFISAYAAAIAAALKQPGATFGLVTSLRGIVDGVPDEAVGLFLNTVPYAVDVAAAPNWAQLATTVRRQVAEGSQYAAVDVASLSAVTGRPVSQLTDTALAFQTYPGADGRFTGSSDHGIATVAVQDHTHYALAVCVYPAEEKRWALRMSYDAGRLTRSWVRDLVDAIVAGLRDIAEDPTRPVFTASEATVSEAAVEAPPAVQTAPENGEAGPRTLAALASAWKDLLGREFSASDDFFLSGGSSVTAMRFAMRLQSTLGVRVPVRAVFEGRTGAEILRYLEKAASRSTES